MMDESTPAENAPILECHQVSKHFDEFIAVDNLSFRVFPGEVYGLLGPNGAGKTTALRMIAGLMQPTSGDIRIRGQSPQVDPMFVKKNIGFATGSTGLYKRLTPIEFLRFFGQISDVSPATLDQRIELMIERLGIGEFQKKQCGTLSTGQKQRVNIARSLLHDPDVLILDEPTSGLDIISADFILQFISQCKEEGKAVIYSTHILAEIDLLCDRVGVLFRGRLQQEGTTEELKQATNEKNFAQTFLSIIQQAQEGNE